MSRKTFVGFKPGVHSDKRERRESGRNERRELLEDAEIDLRPRSGQASGNDGRSDYDPGDEDGVHEERSRE